jgi:hypothetical protein
MEDTGTSEVHEDSDQLPRNFSCSRCQDRTQPNISASTRASGIDAFHGLRMWTTHRVKWSTATMMMVSSGCALGWWDLRHLILIKSTCTRSIARSDLICLMVYCFTSSPKREHGQQLRTTCWSGPVCLHQSYKRDRGLDRQGGARVRKGTLRRACRAPSRYCMDRCWNQRSFC